MRSLRVFFLLGVIACALSAEIPQFGPVFPESLSSGPSLSNTIVNGNLAIHGQFPWQVSIFFSVPSGRQFCGGSLISNRWVLTAAHCVYGALNFTVSLGSVTTANEELGRVTVYTDTAIAHEGYNPVNLNNDIGLIDLGVEIGLTAQIQLVNLPSRGQTVGPNAVVEVSGWGRVSDYSFVVSPTLNYVRLFTLSNAECSIFYGTQVVISSTLCAIGQYLESPCQGDSGGGLVTRNLAGEATLVGVVSFVSNLGCGLGRPSGYVRTEPFLSWISARTGISLT